jgi:hypothetical protein
VIDELGGGGGACWASATLQTTTPAMASHGRADMD